MDIKIESMKGLGDNIYQRAIISQIHPDCKIYLTTPWPEIYSDLPNVFPIYADTDLRTQRKNIERQKGWHEPPASFDFTAAFRYGKGDKSILAAMAGAVGMEIEPDAKIIMDLPAAYKKHRVKTDKPIAIIRPVTTRKEWQNEARSPRPEYIREISLILKQRGYYVVAVADLEEGKEWLEGEDVEADKKFYKGELQIEELIALFRAAALAVGGQGFIVPMVMATKTPAIIVYGGCGALNSPDYVCDRRVHGVKIQHLVPDKFCMCDVHKHDCDKRITDVTEKVEVFLNELGNVQYRNEYEGLWTGSADKPYMTVSVLTLNQLCLLKGCVESLLKHGAAEKFELLIQDQGSTDGTIEWLGSIAESDPRVRLILNSENIGFIEGHKKALQQAQGKYFMVLNDDTVMGKGWFEETRKAFLSSPGIKVVGPIACSLDKDGYGSTARGEQYDYIEGSCLTVPTAFALHYGLWDNKMEMGYGEDSDLSLRVRAMGFQIFKTDFLFKHIGAATSKVVDKRKMDMKGYHIKNHHRLREKWHNYLLGKTFVEKWLVKRTGAMGDVFLLTSIFEHIKRQNKYAHITLTTQAPQMIAGHPSVDEIIGTDVSTNNQHFHKTADLDLAYERYPEKHIVTAYAEALGLEGEVSTLPTFYLGKEERKQSPEKGCVVIHAGPTGWSGRNLPQATWVRVVELLKKEGHRVVEVGHDAKIKGVDESYSGLSLRNVAAIIRDSIGFLGIDSGPMHYAQAFLTPGAVAFGMIDPKCRITHTHLLRPVEAGVGCKYCHHWLPGPRTYTECPRGIPECMLRIEPEQMVGEFKKALEVSKMSESETAKVRERVLKYCEGRGIDIGCKSDKIKPDALGIDMREAKGVDMLLDASKPLPFRDGEFDYVYSSHCLEDIEDTDRALWEWLRILKSGGHIVLYLPHKDLYKGFNADHRHEFGNEDIISILTAMGCKVVENFMDEGVDKYSFCIVGRKQ